MKKKKAKTEQPGSEFSAFSDKHGGVNYAAVLPLHGFCGTRAIYRSRAQLPKVVYSRSCIKSIIYKYVSIRYDLRAYSGFIYLFILLSISLSCKYLQI